MIKYHGTPVTPEAIFFKAMHKRNALISWANPQDLERALNTCKKIILDNGAFTFWKKKQEIDWDDYYKWVFKNYDFITHFIIPDVIDGDERENDLLLFRYMDILSKRDTDKKAIPVWHLHESFERLSFMRDMFDYIAIGSSGEFAELGTYEWHKRMNNVMKVLCDVDGFPKVKIHMLRCLDASIFTQYPFYSGDSTNLARNHARDGWNNILNRIEKYNSPKSYRFKTYHETTSLFGETE